VIRKPTQKRALATYERLLDAAGELLAEVGVGLNWDQAH